MVRQLMSFPRLRLVALLFVLLLPIRLQAYALITHEQLIDLTWNDSIVPLLLSHYPKLTAAELDEARAYAYGGCVIQDIGYYPFGEPSFSNLTHYVRPGDFVVSLLRNAHTANELAFAIGALSHFEGDTIGHPFSVNTAVPIEFPSLAAKYGKSVNYAQGRRQHVQVEFAFDVDEIAHHRVAPLRYLKHIGLRVSMRQLALAFYQTYGITDGFSRFRGRRINVPAYRFATRSFIPRIAYAETLLHRKHEPIEPASKEHDQYDAQVAETAAKDNWDMYRHRAGIGTYMLAGIIFILPKIGPLKLAAIKGPTENTEMEYLHSVLLSSVAFRRDLVRFTVPAVAANASPLRPHNDRHPLPNRDLDTGKVVLPGGYPLTDVTYAALLHRLTIDPTQKIPPGIKEDVQAYYANPDSPITTKKDETKWAQVQADLKTLATMPASSEPEPYPTYGNEVADSE
jgi:hypothetical protein